MLQGFFHYGDWNNKSSLINRMRYEPYTGRERHVIILPLLDYVFYESTS
jgi:hypothetical protein